MVEEALTQTGICYLAKLKVRVIVTNATLKLHKLAQRYKQRRNGFYSRFRWKKSECKFICDFKARNLSYCFRRSQRHAAFGEAFNETQNFAVGPLNWPTLKMIIVLVPAASLLADTENWNLPSNLGSSCYLRKGAFGNLRVLARTRFRTRIRCNNAWSNRNQVIFCCLW